jgi:glycine oxidase ThiO
VSAYVTGRPSVVIVGAGIIGGAIARELSARGSQCTIVDPRPVGGGATQASAGMLAPYVEAHGGGPMLDLCVRSLDLYDDWIAALRGEGAAIEYRRIGTLEVALSEDRAAALRGGPGEWLDRDAVARLVPQLAPAAGALRNERHGYVDARQLAQALAQSAERHGAAHSTLRVERIDRRDGTLVVDVGPDRDPLVADTVVLAAGAWGNRIHGVRTPPLRPVRGQLLLHDGGIGRIPSILWGPDCYIVPREHNPGLMIGATVEEAGFDERPTDEAAATLFAAACTLLPALGRIPSDGVRVGLRPATPDELPVLGDDPSEPGIVHASGHYRNGVLLAPITAKLIGDLLIDGRRDAALESFAVTRFD